MMGRQDWLGSASQGAARQGKAWPGAARLGGAWQGKAGEIMNCDRCVMDQDPRYEGSPWFHQLWCPNRPEGPIWDRWPTGRLYEEDDDH